MRKLRPRKSAVAGEVPDAALVIDHEVERGADEIGHISGRGDAIPHGVKYAFGPQRRHQMHGEIVRIIG